MDRIIETTPHETTRLGEQGSALVSVLMLVVLGFISTAAYIQFQKFLNDENRIVAQKLESAQWQQALSRAFADFNTCAQFNGVVVNQDPPNPAGGPVTFTGEITAPATLYKAGTSGAFWARQGFVIPGSDTKLGVTRIRLAGLVQAPFAPGATAPNEYVGYIEIGLGPVNDPNEPVNMTRSIRPIRIKKRFTTSGGAPTLTVTGCTELPAEIFKVDAYQIITPVGPSGSTQMQASGGTVADNTMLDTKLSWAECPAGTKVVGGGYQILPGGTGCDTPAAPNPDLADVAIPLSNYPYFGNFGGPDREGWVAWVLCQNARAFAYCMTEPPKPGSP